MNKMGRTLVAGTAFAAAALSTLGGCGIGKPAETVYGPPEWFESETAESLEPPTAVTNPETGEPDTTEPETTEPETDTTNPAEGVYGPPSWFE